MDEEQIKSQPEEQFSIKIDEPKLKVEDKDKDKQK